MLRLFYGGIRCISPSPVCPPPPSPPSVVGSPTSHPASFLAAAPSVYVPPDRGASHRYPNEQGHYPYLRPVKAARYATISSVRVVPSGCAKFVLKFLVTVSSTPQGRLMMATMTSSMVKAASGMMYHLTAFHHCRPVTSWKLTTFGSWRQSASRVKCSASR